MFVRCLLASLILPLSLAAGSWCGYDFDVWAAGEAILWRPMIELPFYTILGPVLANSTPEGNQVGVIASYDWGYRLELGLRQCNHDLRLSWASLNAGQTSEVRAGPNERVWFISVHANNNEDFFENGIARENTAIHYDVLDADVGRWICRECSCFSTRLFAGVRYARLTVNRTITYIDILNPPDFVRTIFESDHQGWGPRFGVGGRYDVCWGLHLLGEASGALLLGSTKAFSRLIDATPPPSDEDFTHVHNQSVPLVIPALEVKFGVGLCRALCGVIVLGEVGYQISSYSNAQVLTQWFEAADAEGQNLPLFGTFDVDGWYFRLGGQF